MSVPNNAIQEMLSFVVPRVQAHHAKWQHQQTEFHRPFLLALSGLQGSGKSTYASQLALALEHEHHFRVIVCSLDDFYHDHDTLVKIKNQNRDNGLLQVRGQPGTHDEALGQGDRVPEEDWKVFVPSVDNVLDIVIFEGWCMGFKSLEKMNSSKNGKIINDNLRRYNTTFMNPANFDSLIHLDTEELANVYRWRVEQEHNLWKVKGTGMTDASVIQFVQDYMPAYELYLEELQRKPFIPRGSETASNNCVVKTARRECKNEHNHRNKLPSSSQSSIPLPSDEEPCQSHLSKAKAAYSEILNNFGCICKVLLSLNLESCCALESGTVRRKSLDKDGFLTGIRKASSGGSSVKSVGGASCAEKLYCSPRRTKKTGSDIGINSAAKARPRSDVKTSPKQIKEGSDCCVEETSFNDQAPALDCGKGCCSEPDVGQAVTSRSISSCGKGSCSKPAVDPVSIAAPLDDCKKGCCSEPTSTPPDKESTLDRCCPTEVQAGKHTILGVEEANGRKIVCQDLLNPAGKPLVTREACCSKTISGGNKCSQDIEILPYTSKTSADQVDLEKGVLQVEHLIISVQGMTFYREMTGFTCSKMTLSGHELDLIVEDPTIFIGDKELPYGISGIVVHDTRTIRVTYHPEVLGARDLMGNPFFELAKLAPMTAPPLITSGRAHLRLMLFKTLVSIVLTIPVLIMAWAELPPREIAYGAASLVLATIVQVYIAGPWYSSAFKALFFSHLIEVDFLVVLSTSIAYIYSIIAYARLAYEKPLSTGSFFETSTLLVTLVMVGRLVTSLARQRAVESISIESLQPSTAILIDSNSDSLNEIDARLLQYGDVFVVSPDSSVATDGTVISGISDVDESMITGEATLVAKQPGSPVVAGSTNHSGTLKAKSSKARFQDMADRVAAYFVPIILVLTVIVFVVRVGVGKGILDYSTTTACINAMTYAISALIVSCPCAIGLAVPMVLVIAGGVAAKNGVIFNSAETIERARNISHVVFDKTGTLTQGLLAVERETYPTGEGITLGPMILGLTSSSKHPVSSAIAAHLKLTVTKADELKEITSIVGCGIEATWGEEKIRAGNPYWLVYGLKDRLRPDATAVINELRRRNIEISIISGDNEESVKKYRLQKNIVMFCGDGTNDAVALAQASIGVHINGSTGIAQNAADAVLIRPALSGVIVLIDLSKTFYRRVVFNFTWSFVYNTFAILLAAGAFPNARIPPQYAGLGEIVSVLPVIAIGVQLRWASFTNFKV
ncbi:copper-transporting atpase [Botrytis cinerea]